MKRKRVLIIGYVWPEPSSSAAGGRMLQLIEQFHSAGYDITFASPSQKGMRAANLSHYEVEEEEIKLNNSSFDHFVKELNPEVVVFDRFMMEEQFGWRVAEHCPTALRILDTEDLHSLRKERQLCVKNDLEFYPELLLESETAQREIASILRCDFSLIISTYEMQLLTELFKLDEALLYHLPLMLDRVEDTELQRFLSYEEREHFLFIGNFLHAPNVDAALQLKTKWWPEIRKLIPEAEFHLYGAYPTQQILQLHKPQEGFFVKGPVDDAKRVVSEARVLLAPVRFGAGIKGKLTEAMCCGTPSVTTAIGAEGMHEGLPWSGLVSGEDFAQNAVKLYLDEPLWRESQSNGIKIINERYDKANLGSAFIQQIEKRLSCVEEQRRKNFLGRLLRHQTLNATKYMSMWIEAKNK